MWLLTSSDPSGKRFSHECGHNSAGTWLSIQEFGNRNGLKILLVTFSHSFQTFDDNYERDL